MFYGKCSKKHLSSFFTKKRNSLSKYEDELFVTCKKLVISREKKLKRLIAFRVTHVHHAQAVESQTDFLNV